MTRVMHALRSAKRHVRAANTSSTQRDVDPRTVVGSDGLTESERLELLVRYRSTVGAKPAATEAHQLRSEAIKEKLQARPRPRPRHGV